MAKAQKIALVIDPLANLGLRGHMTGKIRRHWALASARKLGTVMEEPGWAGLPPLDFKNKLCLRDAKEDKFRNASYLS
ncbi:MAG: hypothetical protein GY800_07940 [Planctomycetes bacterium]|nr:hypothetical protein [Planctomycetota bacterium]